MSAAKLKITFEKPGEIIDPSMARLEQAYTRKKNERLLSRRLGTIRLGRVLRPLFFWVKMDNEFQLEIAEQGAPKPQREQWEKRAHIVAERLRLVGALDESADKTILLSKTMLTSLLEEAYLQGVTDHYLSVSTG